MQASQIRDKYKQILEEPESQNSEDEWEMAYSQMAKQRKKRILTEASPNKTYQENSDVQSMMAIKQKLAQSLANCKEHCKEMEKLKKQQMVFEEDRIEWEETAAELNKTIEEQRDIVKQNGQKIVNLEQEIAKLTAKVEEVAMDRELQQRQSEYYRQELAHLKEDIEKREKEFKANQKELKQFQRIKKENEYLRGDVERLSSLIEDSLRFGKVSNELIKKHFLGKPHKELDYWFSQNLVGEVEQFLKKHQVGYGNKEFTYGLVKFIDKIRQKSVKEPELKIKNIHSTSKHKQNNTSVRKPSKIILDNSNYKKHSYNISSLREEALLRSNTSSFWKANESTIFNEPHNQGYWQVTIKTACFEIITEFKSIVFELLLEKEVKRKKIKKLIDSMYNAVMEAFDGNQSHCTVFNERKNQFSAINLEVDDITTPLKTLK